MTETLLHAAILVPCLIVAIVFHEVAHGWMALMLGDPTAKEQRRLSLNPIRHVDPIGTLLGMLIGGLLADSVGWRNAFLIVGLPGIALAVVVFTYLKDPRRTGMMQAGTQQSAEQMPMKVALKAMFSSRAFVLLVAAGSAAAFLAYGKVTWITIFFQRTHGLTPGETGLWFGLVNGGAGIAGTVLGGYIADRWGAKNRRHVLTAPAVGMVVTIPFALLAFMTDNWLLALFLLIVPMICNSLYYGPTYSSVQGLVPLRARAIAAAVLLFFQNLIGLGLGPLFFGMMSDLLQPAYGEESVRYVLYGATFLGLLPAFFFWRCSLRLNEELDQKD